MGCGGSNAAKADTKAKAAGDPVLYYFPIAARGEVARMVAKLGGLTMEDKFTDGKDMDVASFGSPGSVPVFQHGNLKLTQSHAIVSYVSQISPKYKDLTPKQRAKDLQMNAIMDDLMAEMAQILFSSDDAETKSQNMKKPIEKWMPIIESLLPDKSITQFINGLPFPTAADFAMLVVAKGQTPFQGSFNMAKVSIKEYEKFQRYIDGLLKDDTVNDYLKMSQSLNGNPFNLPLAA